MGQIPAIIFADGGRASSSPRNLAAKASSSLVFRLFAVFFLRNFLSPSHLRRLVGERSRLAAWLDTLVPASRGYSVDATRHLQQMASLLHHRGVDPSGPPLATSAQSRIAPPIQVGSDQSVDNPVPGTHGGVNHRVPHIAGDGQYGYTRTNTDGTPKKHHGVDLTAPEGSPVRANVSGWLIPIPNNGGAGNEVRIIAEDGKTYRFMHLQDGSLPPKGTYVRKGDFIANVGRTGNVPEKSPSHVHFEVRDQDWNSVPTSSTAPMDDATKARQFENYIDSLPREPTRPEPSPSPDPASPSTPQPNLERREAPPQSAPPSTESESAFAWIGREVGKLLFGEEAYAGSMPPTAQANLVEAQQQQTPNTAKQGSRPSDAEIPQHGQVSESNAVPSSGGTDPYGNDEGVTQRHVPVADQIQIPRETEVGDHRPGADPQATVSVGSGNDGGGIPANESEPSASAPNDGNPGYDPPVVRPGEQSQVPSSPSEQDFQQEMERRRNSFQNEGTAESRPAIRRPAEDYRGESPEANPPSEQRNSGDANGAQNWDAPGPRRPTYDAQGNRSDSSRPSYDEQGYRTDGSRPTYDEQGYYSDGSARENRGLQPLQQHQPASGRHSDLVRRSRLSH